MIKAGIVGVSGYAGAQLLLLLLQHKKGNLLANLHRTPSSTQEKDKRQPHG